MDGLWATKSEDAIGYMFMQLVSTISNLGGPDPPTLQADRRTDDMQWQYRALHYSASRGRNCNYGPPRRPVNNEANLLHHVI